MKTKLFLILCILFATFSFMVMAEDNVTNIQLTLSSPNDGPAQDGKDPITPNQFSATLNDHTLTISTQLNDEVSVQIKNLYTNKNVVNTNFTDRVEFNITENGYFALIIYANNTTLEGFFDIKLSQKDAADIVLNIYEKDDVVIFVSNQTYTAGDTIHILYEDSFNKYIIADKKVWVAFVDLIPDANWAHECIYILIDAYSGDMSTFEREMPPQSQSKLFTIYKMHDEMGIPISAEEAYNIVKEKYNADTISIYVCTFPYLSGSRTLILQNDYKIEPPQGEYWVVFIDLEPFENWSHACKYIYVERYTKQIIEYDNDMFPKNLSTTFSIYQKAKCPWNNADFEMPYTIFDNNRKNFVSQNEHNLHNRTEQNNNKWAIIISGGGDIQTNWIRYWYDCSAVYKTLIAHGYNREHIFVAISDGQNDAPDYTDYNYVQGSSQWDLDGDGTYDTQYPSTITGIYQMFNDINNVLPQGSEVFIFTTDHGYRENNHSYLCLWGNYNMIDYEFATLVESLNAERVNIIMEQCNSGGFIDDFQNPNFDQVVITTACDYNQKSYARYDYHYDEFIYWWCTAVNGITPDGNTLGNADYNNDGYISMQEAYMFTCLHDNRLESPQQYSNDYCLKFSLTLTDILSLCSSPVMVNGYDIYVKDNANNLHNDITFDIFLIDNNGDVIGGERFMYEGDGTNNTEAQPNIQNTEPLSQLNMLHCTPNPADDNITITAIDDILLVNIYNTQGHKVISTNNTHINVSNLQKGIYLINAQTKNGNYQTKFVKK